MIQFEPYYLNVVWGGQKIAQYFYRVVQGETIGEAWELTEIPGKESRCISEPYKGFTLSQLYQQGLFSRQIHTQFPFLLKWIDAAQPLSVQVHPDEDACKQLQQGHPKTEAWYVAHAEPGAVLYLGHKPGLTPGLLREAIAENNVKHWLREIYPKAGEFYLVPAGTIHAIGAGLLLLEVQQPSDTTFRLYDWNRLGLDGKPRALHLEESIQSIHFLNSAPVLPDLHEVVGPCFKMKKLYTGETILEETGIRVFVCVSENATLTTEHQKYNLQFGDVYVAEAQDFNVFIQSGDLILVSEYAA